MDEAVRKRIIALADKNGGRIEPDQVIEDAQNPKSPLHGEFDWDVEKAAWEHWRDVARGLIRSVQVERVVHNRTVTSIAYVRDPQKASGEQGYVALDTIKGTERLAHAALIAEFDRASSALERALAVAAALELEKDVESLLRRIGLTRAKAAKKMAG